MHVKVITPRNVIQDTHKVSVTLPTVDGEVTIMKHHIPLLTLLCEGIITLRDNKDEDYIAIGSGYAETDGNTLTILVSRAYKEDEINQELTERAIAEARKIAQETKDDNERAAALATLHRSSIDMKLLKKRRHPPSIPQQ